MTATVHGVFSRFGDLTDEQLGRVPERFQHLQWVLSEEYLPPVGECKAAILQAKGWFPKPKKIIPIKGSDWESRFLKNEVKAWGAKPKLAVSKRVQELFVAVLEQRGRERVELDQAYGFRYCLIPEVDLTPGFYKNAGWVAPCDWLYEVSKKGQILLPNGERTDPTHLNAGVGMVDMQCKPSYQDGRQRFSDDLAMEAIIEHLHDEGAFDTRKAPDGVVAGSRFYLSRRDYENVIAPLLKEIFELKDPATVRLERVAEWSVLSQYKNGSNWPRARDGETNTWVWFHECFGSVGDSLGGGGSGGGGLAGVGRDGSDVRWHNECGRLLAVWDMPA